MTSPQGERREAGAPPRRGVQLWLLLALVLALWAASFYPILIQHRSLSIAGLIDARNTGEQARGVKRSQMGPLKSLDASFLQVHLPLQAFLAGHWRLGHYPEWNPLVGLGHPVSSDPLYKPTDPFFWPFFLAPSAWMFSLGIALNALFGALGCTLLLRALGLSPEATILGAALFTVGPLTAQSLVFSSAWGAWIAVWGLLGVEYWIQGRRWGLPLATAACALMIYCGHPLIGPLYLVAILCYLVIRGWHLGWRRLLSTGAILVIVLAALTALHTLPLLAGLNLYESYKAAWDGGPFHSLSEFANPRSPVYLPASFLVLALLGAARPRAERLRVFALGMVAYGFLLMLPVVGGLPRLIISLGGLVVGQYGEELFWLGTLMLMALGLDHLVRERGRERVRWVCVGIGLAYWALSTWTFSASVGDLYWREHFLWTAAAEAGRWLILAVLCVSARPLRLVGAVATLALASLPLTLPFPLSRFYTSEDVLLQPPPVVRSLEARLGPDLRWRISGSLPRDATLPVLMPNQASLWNIADLRFCHPLMLSGYVRAVQPWNRANIFPTMQFLPKQDEEALAFFGVRYYLDEAKRPKLELPVRERVGVLTVKEVPDPAPWARLVEEWTVGANADDEFRRSVALIRDSGWRQRVVLDRPPVWAGAPGSDGPAMPKLTWVDGRDDQWTWEAEASRPTLLVFVMNAHPGWRVRVDGTPARLLRAYGGFMAVALSPGRHDIVLTFRDPWLRAGAWVSALGWMGLLSWVAYACRQRPPNRVPAMPAGG
jgi:hypothetical protein